MAKLLVTGGCGFIGSALVDKLVELGREVVVWDNCSTGSKENLNPGAEYACIDISEVFPESHEFEAIFHLAALPRIQPSFARFLEVQKINVIGTCNMLELAKKCKSRFVFTSSSSVYYNHDNPYTFSKYIAERYCLYYKQMYRVKLALARVFNVYGPRQIEEGDYATVIGIFERQKRNNQPLTVTGTGGQRRDFTHVEDVVEGLILAEKYLENANSLQIDLGTGINHSIKEVAEMFNGVISFVPERNGEAFMTQADIVYTTGMLGWKPKQDLFSYIKSIK